jgi:hypothetical protein
MNNNITDGGGQYRVDVPAGVFTVSFLSPEGNGLASLPRPGQFVVDDVILDATLPPGVTLSGRVTDPLGVGIFNADLDFDDPLTGVAYPVFDDDTDALGNYTAVLPPGTYDVNIDPGPGVRLVAELHPGQIVAGPTTFDIQLEAGVFVSGQVVDTGSNPWPNIDIDVRFPGTLIEIETARDDTDPDGLYQVVVPVGTWDFVFTPSPGVPVQSGITANVVVTADMVLDKVLQNSAIGVADAGAPPAVGVELLPVRPNPFNPSATIGFRLDAAGPVRLAIYDVAGRSIRVLLDEPRPAGAYTLVWDGRNQHGSPAASGVYFLRLAAPAATVVQKVVLAR